MDCLERSAVTSYVSDVLGLVSLDLHLDLAANEVVRELIVKSLKANA